MAENIIVRNNIVKLRVGDDWFYYDASAPPLGEGAMGTVYLGRHVRDNHYLVAIKLVKSNLSRLQGVRVRARQEASLAYRHHNLVEMIGICEDDSPNGVMFIVSKFVSGDTIENHIQQFAHRKDRVRRTVMSMMPVLDALEFLHDKNIIHLDIKPCNIMVENGRNIRLMDLGISCVDATSGTGGSGLLGTPGYAAPEQYLNGDETGPVFTPATDVYQFGASLYELLSGKKPYSDNPDKLSKIDGVDSALMKVIRKTLAKEPFKRYDNVRTLKAALHNAMTKRDSWLDKIVNYFKN